MAEKYHSMPLFYKELEADEAVKLMSPSQFGCYIRLLISCWHEGSLPIEISKVESLSTYKGKHFRSAIWACMKDKFPKGPDGRLHNKMVDKKRTEIKEKKEKQSSGGKAGAEKRWGSHGLPNGLPTPKKWVGNSISESESESESESKKESILLKLGNAKIQELKDYLEEFFNVRGWLLDGLADKVFNSVLIEVSEYEPRQIFPYFKKSLLKYINDNAQWISEHVKKAQ